VIASGLTAAPLTDGERYVVSSPAVGTIHVLDTETGSSFDAAPGDQCLSPTIAAVGGGQALLKCAPTADRGWWVPPLLLDLETRAFHAPANANVMSPGDGGSFVTGVGSVGIAFGRDGHSSFVGALNWTTGAVVNETKDHVFDLDRPTLLTPICAPVLAKASTFVSGLHYQRPFALETTRSGLELQRCGSTRTALLQPGHPAPLNATDSDLASGFVTWIVPGALDATLSAYLPKCQAKLTWTVSNLSMVGHVRDGVILSEQFIGGGPWQVRQLSIDGVCARVSSSAQLTIRTSGRRLTGTARSGTLPDAPTGADIALPRPTKAPAQFSMRAGRAVSLRIVSAARSVRWHVLGSPWALARRKGAGWTFRAPRTRVTRTLAVSAALTNGGTEQFELRVPRTER